jgi:hypothetical protein
MGQKIDYHYLLQTGSPYGACLAQDILWVQHTDFYLRLFLMK